MSPIRSGDPDAPSLRERAWAVLRAGVLGGAAVTALGLLVHTGWAHPSFEVHEVSVVGAERVDPIALRHLADLRQGTHLLAADLAHAVAGVEQHPWVDRAHARIVFPGTIELTIVEHQPRLLLAMGELWYVGPDGLPFRRAKADDLDYPVLTGLDAALLGEHPDLGPAVTRAALALVAAGHGHPHLQPENLSEVHFDLDRGFTLILRSGSEVYLGWHEPSERFVRLSALVDAGLDLERPQRIDLGGSELAIATPLAPPELSG